MQAQSKASDTFMAIASALAEANPPENARDRAHVDLALELSAYIHETYRDASEGLATLAQVFGHVACALRYTQTPASADCYIQAVR